MHAPSRSAARPWRRRLLTGACLVPAGVVALAAPAGAQEVSAESVQANLDNAADKDYWSTAGNGLLGVGAPRTLRVAAKFDL